MNSSVLYPPSFNRFGDAVIGKVILRESVPSHARSVLSTQDDEEPKNRAAPISKGKPTQL
ncbi:hypothetical protein V7S43_016052 [Phytophthora oleae]|uniref:Uncharacterized protein n=1 Tax=Phytophthora oleae TaxID=2107226 RepID=A0ABD3EXA0_9STRA